MAVGQSLFATDAKGMILPGSSMATWGKRNNHPVLKFDAASTETAYYEGILPTTYDGGSITVDIDWMAATATTGNVIWSVAIERMQVGTGDLDSDGFASAVTGSASAAPGTSGVMQRTSIQITGGNLDSLAEGERFRLQVNRLGGNGSDTMAGDAELLGVYGRES